MIDIGTRKARCMYLRELLLSRTNENEKIDLKGINKYMRSIPIEEYSYKSISQDIQVLQEGGLEIHTEKERRVRYYWVVERLFDTVELKLLVDGQLHYLSLITDEGVPDWVRGEWSSYTSPKLLEEFGAELGYKVKSLYNAFPSGSEEWYQYHYCVQAAEDGEMYSICHVSETNCYTGIRSKDNIPKIDFKNYPKYYLRLR